MAMQGQQSSSSRWQQWLCRNKAHLLAASSGDAVITNFIFLLAAMAMQGQQSSSCRWQHGRCRNKAHLLQWRCYGDHKLPSAVTLSITSHDWQVRHSRPASLAIRDLGPPKSRITNHYAPVVTRDLGPPKSQVTSRGSRVASPPAVTRDLESHISLADT